MKRTVATHQSLGGKPKKHRRDYSKSFHANWERPGRNFEAGLLLVFDQNTYSHTDYHQQNYSRKPRAVTTQLSPRNDDPIFSTDPNKKQKAITPRQRRAKTEKLHQAGYLSLSVLCTHKKKGDTRKCTVHFLCTVHSTLATSHPTKIQKSHRRSDATTPRDKH